MAKLLMPKATAVWLIENTILTFEQISDFCGLHKIEIQAIADGNVESSLQSLSPIINHQLTSEEIKRCEEDPNHKLKITENTFLDVNVKTKGRRATYVPISKRAEKPDSIAWCINNHPELSDAQIQKLVGTTKNTVVQIRQRVHWNYANLEPRSPAKLNLCTHDELQSAVDIGIAKQKKQQAASQPEEVTTDVEETKS